MCSRLCKDVQQYLPTNLDISVKTRPNITFVKDCHVGLLLHSTIMHNYLVLD